MGSSRRVEWLRKYISSDVKESTEQMISGIGGTAYGLL